MNYQIICTFDKIEQIILTLNFEKNVDEEEFINQILDNLYEEEIKELVKLSCCQLNTSKFEDLPNFIQNNNGKYYFNEGKWKEFKNEYLSILY